MDRNAMGSGLQQREFRQELGEGPPKGRVSSKRGPPSPPTTPPHFYAHSSAPSHYPKWRWPCHSRTIFVPAFKTRTVHSVSMALMVPKTRIMPGAHCPHGLFGAHSIHSLLGAHSPYGLLCTHSPAHNIHGLIDAHGIHNLQGSHNRRAIS
ncbi:hypothetical protein AMTR_s00098p00070840 [Amborella trichopoda]|uniref:Uncharacterized protein n=1 Tax=Amborella trichopoda TaxID=13333 RepID=W1NYR1_AMBTC|nr:hypothetical protein AMTR_s00098p00070840 [Amborella trichopoda]